MQYTNVFFTLAAMVAVASAMVTPAEPLEKRIADPGNPANLVNCEPGGGADDCHLEQPCARIRINYGSRQQDHFIWYNYDINDVPVGAVIGVEDSCSDF